MPAAPLMMPAVGKSGPGMCCIRSPMLASGSSIRAMTASITCREAVGDDIPAIVALVESAYRGDASRQGWTTEADLLDGQRIDVDGVRAIIEDPLARVLLVVQGGEDFVRRNGERFGELRLAKLAGGDRHRPLRFAHQAPFRREPD